jgi:DNA-binding GntR family transcriptional regulator
VAVVLGHVLQRLNFHGGELLSQQEALAMLAFGRTHVREYLVSLADDKNHTDYSSLLISV